jgi:argininosuccinate lyase
MRERLKLPPSKELVEYIIRPRLESGSHAKFEPLMNLNRAHVVMLAAQGIVNRASARSLMQVLDSVLAEGPDAITWDPALEEAYYNIEAHIIKKAGAGIGGQLHTARSRNDLGAALTRISTRKQLMAMAERVHELRAQLLDLAGKHADTIVTGYTHMQPAQPTTLGHYFHALAHALERDETRLQQAYEVVNMCPLGACAFNATGFPIDRQMLSDLTGFSGLIENSIDALASRDYVTQVLSALASMCVTLSRMAQDLYMYSTDEFGWLEMGDDVSTTSSIMPQKKNPITLEHIRAKSSHLIGAVVATLAAQKGVPYGHLRDISLESGHPMKEALKEGEAVVALATATLRSLRVREGVAESRAARNFSTVTELADVLVREAGISFREAHLVVAYTVSGLIDRGQNPQDLTLELVDSIAKKHLGKPLGLSNESLSRALSPKENVSIRSVIGGPAPDEVRRSLSASEARFVSQCAWWERKRQDLIDAQDHLDRAATRLFQ